MMKTQVDNDGDIGTLVKNAGVVISKGIFGSDSHDEEKKKNDDDDDDDDGDDDDVDDDDDGGDANDADGGGGVERLLWRTVVLNKCKRRNCRMKL